MTKSQNLTTYGDHCVKMLVQIRCFIFAPVPKFSLLSQMVLITLKKTFIISSDVFQQCKDGIMPEDIKAVLLQQAGFHPVM
jgi:hypothetical protein